MPWRTWLQERAGQADLVNLGVIVVFGLLLGAGGVAAMNSDAPEAAPPKPFDEHEEDRDESDEDDEGSDGKDGKGKNHEEDDHDG